MCLRVNIVKVRYIDIPVFVDVVTRSSLEQQAKHWNGW